MNDYQLFPPELFPWGLFAFRGLDESVVPSALHATLQILPGEPDPDQTTLAAQ